MKRAKIALAFPLLGSLFYRLHGQRVACGLTVPRNLRFERVQPVKFLFGPIKSSSATPNSDRINRHQSRTNVSPAVVRCRQRSGADPDLLPRHEFVPAGPRQNFRAHGIDPEGRLQIVAQFHICGRKPNGAPALVAGSTALDRPAIAHECCGSAHIAIAKLANDR